MPAPFNRAASRVRAHVLRVAIVMLGAHPVFAQSPATIPAPRTASLGSCRLASGATIAPCRVAYRTFGTLSPSRDNVILVPTFFAGRSEDHFFMLGTYVDTTRYHVVIVDALADGHSASPSNVSGGRTAFSSITIGDMVDVQHRFLVEHLGLREVHAVVGISMGGFQALEWAVRHPTFMRVAVPIVASPRATPYDQLVYETLRRSVEALDVPTVDVDSAWMQASRIETLFMRTRRLTNDSSSAVLARSVRDLATAYRSQSWSLADYAAQLRAIASHDVSARFGGDMARSAAAVRARLLLVWTPDDLIVDPRPTEAFARLAGAETFVVPSGCGHAVFWCEADKIGAEVRAFIARDPSTALPSSSTKVSRVRRSP
jgi:homoserine O-acetyltransferase